MADAAACAFFANAPKWKCACRPASSTPGSIRASSMQTSSTDCRGRRVSWCCRSSEETVTPLCAPHIAAAIESPADLLRHPLIQSDNKQVRWPAWFALNGIAVPASSRGSRFDRSFLAIAAAADGLGMALESTLLAEREIGRGRLVAPLAGRAQDIRYVGHHLVYPPPVRAADPAPALCAMARTRARYRAHARLSKCSQISGTAAGPASVGSRGLNAGTIDLTRDRGDLDQEPLMSSAQCCDRSASTTNPDGVRPPQQGDRASARSRERHVRGEPIS